MKISSSNPDERKAWGGSIFYDSRPTTSPYTFQNIYVGHLHFISRKCHILTSNTLSWHLFFETLYSASSALYHLLCVSISTRFDWPIKRAISHCIVSILSSLLLRRSFGSSPPPEPVLGTRTRDEPPRTSTWETRIAAALWEKWALFPRFSPTFSPSLRSETGRRENLGTRLPALIPISRKKSGERRPNSNLFRRLFWSQFERGKTL